MVFLQIGLGSRARVARRQIPCNLRINSQIIVNEMPVEIVSNDEVPEEVEEERRDENEERPRPNLARQTSFQRELADAIVRLDSLEGLKTLLDCGANVDEPVTQGLTPLHYAVWQRYYGAAELLIYEGCKMNTKDEIGYSAMHLSAEHGYLEMIELLLKHGAQVNFNQNDPSNEYPMSTVEEPLRLALKNDHYEAAKLLLEHGANPNTCYFFGYEINLVSPFNTQQLGLLLSYGANPNARDRQSFSPLMKACRLQQGIDSVLLLISHGADVNLRADKRHDNRSVLHYAVLSGSVPIVNLLIKQGAQVTMEKDYGRPSPLDLAILKGDVSIIKILIEAGANVNDSSPIIGTPLHVACSDGIKNRIEILKMLFDNKANPNAIILNDDNDPIRSPLAEYLSSNEDFEIEVIDLFLKYGAEVIMESQCRNPKGILRSIPDCIKFPKVVKHLLEAASNYDVAVIMNSSRITKEQKDLYLSFGKNALSLLHLSRVFLRRELGLKLPSRIEELEIPTVLKKYLLYE